MPHCLPGFRFLRPIVLQYLFAGEFGRFEICQVCLARDHAKGDADQGLDDGYAAVDGPVTGEQILSGVVEFPLPDVEYGPASQGANHFQDWLHGRLDPITGDDLG